nr:NADH dehydrogenase subunit 3 [Travisia sanrikuensis]
MTYSIIFSFMAIAISLVVFLAAILLSHPISPDREKHSPFECGFDPFKSARIPFSLRFFLLAVIFLIFDIEIALLMPIPNLLHNMPRLLVSFWSSLFLLILLIGLLHEWREGSLNWAE